MSHFLLPAWRTVTVNSASISTRSSCRRCIQALHGAAASGGGIDGVTSGYRNRRYATSSTSSSSSTPSTSTSTSSSSKLPTSDSTSQPQPSNVPKPRLRSQHELYNVSSRTRRVYLYNEDTAKMLVDKMDLGKTPNLVVMDLYAGTGALSKHVLKLPNVSQVIGIEDAHMFTAQLHDLIEDSVGRFAQIALDPYWWDSYRVTQEKGLLDGVKKTEWTDDLTNLAVIGVIPANINGDRLVVQQITCIASQSWLYKYGRFSSYFLIPRPYAMRILAEPGNKERRKLAVMLQALADIELLVDTPEHLAPTKDHFKPLRSKISNLEYVLVKFTPKKERDIQTIEDMEMLEFLTRNMFVHRSAKWVDSLKYLAPGASILKDIIKKSGYQLDPKKKAKDFTSSDWLALIQAFKDWPFRPDHLDQDDVRNSYEEEE